MAGRLRRLLGRFLADRDACTPHDHVLLRDREDVVPGPVDHQPRRETGEEEHEDKRHEQEYLGLDRVRRLRVHALLQEHGETHGKRPDSDAYELKRPKHRNVPGQQSEAVEDRGRILRRKILDPAEERRVAHLDGDEHHLVKGEEDRNLDHDRQTARGRVGAFLLVKRHHLLIEALLVVAEALAQLQHFGLKLPHLGHGAVRLVGEREEHQLDAHGEDQDPNAEVADHLRQVTQGIEQRLGQEIEPAEIDGQVEVNDPQIVPVIVEHFHHLGAGEQAARTLGRPARLDRHVLVEIIGLVLIHAAFGVVQETGADRLVLIGDERHQPVLVRDADPAAGGIRLDQSVILEVAVVDLIQRAVEDPERALVQDVEAQDVRRAGARDESVGRECDRRRAVVRDPLGYREQVVFVDLVNPLEAQSLAVVPGQTHRPAWEQDIVVGPPDGFRVRHAQVTRRRRPAVVDEIGIGRAGRRQQDDLVAVLVEGFAILGKNQVIDSPARE